MTGHVRIIAALLACCATYADRLIDDFERGATKNYLGGSWYYFSDVNDSGNSQILNATLLSNGNYSAIIPDTGGYNSGKCAKMEFVLGDSTPLITSNSGSSFVGIGTDLDSRSGTIDIHSATGIGFKARGSDTMVIFVELMTSTDSNYNCYRAYFKITPLWQEYKIDFSDTKTFMFPTYREQKKKPVDYEYLKSTHPLDVSKVQKINWQASKSNDDVVHPSPLIDYLDYYNLKNLSLYIDELVLLGIAPDPTAVGNNTLVRQKNEPLTITTASDLLGRSLLVAAFIQKTNGLFIFPGTQKGQPIIFSGKKQ